MVLMQKRPTESASALERFERKKIRNAPNKEEELRVMRTAKKKRAKPR